MARFCVLLLLVAPLALADSIYAPPEPSPCYGPPVTETETVTNTNTVTVTAYSTVFEEKVEVETKLVPTTVTTTLTIPKTVTTTNTVTNTEQEYTTVYSTSVNTNTVTETKTVTNKNTQHVTITKTECMGAAPTVQPSHPAPTSFVSAGFGPFKGYQGFREFNFAGYNPF